MLLPPLHPPRIWSRRSLLGMGVWVGENLDKQLVERPGPAWPVAEEGDRVSISCLCCGLSRGGADSGALASIHF